jgi:hypothetical protein
VAYAIPDKVAAVPDPNCEQVVCVGVILLTGRAAAVTVAMAWFEVTVLLL